jgi:hypothetical protein
MRHRARREGAAVEVLREHRRSRLARLLQPGARDAVAGRPVLFGQHGVGGLAHQRVAEHVLDLARKSALPARRHELAPGQVREQHLHSGRVLRSAHERRDRALPEDLPEQARGAQNAPRLRRQVLEPGLHDRDDGLRQRVAAALCHGADQLLEVERVALRLAHDALDRLHRDRVAQHLAHDALAALAQELAEGHPVQADLVPEPREQLAHLGPREREQQDRRVGQAAQGRVHELQGRQIGPVHVVEQEHERPGAGLRRAQVDPGAPHLVAHELGVVAGGPELHAGLVGKRGADELAQELGDAGLIRGGHVPRDASQELVAADGDRLAVLDRSGAADHGSDEPEGRAGVHGVAAGDPDLGLRSALFEQLCQLVAQP